MGACVCFLLVTAVSLHGCCSTEHQLSWEPDVESFKKMTDQFDENGMWQGNPTWSFFPTHEAEEYFCKTMHATRPICMVWTSKEWNCEKQDFGLCKCHTLATDGDYCQAWGCHSLEADQNKCKRENCERKANKRRCKDPWEDKWDCYYDAFRMTEGRYQELVTKQSEGSLTTGEQSWWSFLDTTRRLPHGNASVASSEAE